MRCLALKQDTYRHTAMLCKPPFPSPSILIHAKAAHCTSTLYFLPSPKRSASPFLFVFLSFPPHPSPLPPPPSPRPEQRGSRSCPYKAEDSRLARASGQAGVGVVSIRLSFCSLPLRKIRRDQAAAVTPFCLPSALWLGLGILAPPPPPPQKRDKTGHGGENRTRIFL